MTYHALLALSSNEMSPSLLKTGFCCADALANMEGEEIMLDIYDDIHDELKAAKKVIQKEKDSVQPCTALS